MSRPRMPSITLPVHVHLVRSRGREYFYFRPHRGTKRAGKSVPLPGCPTNPDGAPNAEWWAAYRRLAGEPEPNGRPGTFGALIVAFKASPEWAELSESTRTDWTRYFNVVLAAWGANLVRAVEPHHVLALRDVY